MSPTPPGDESGPSSTPNQNAETMTSTNSWWNHLTRLFDWPGWKGVTGLITALAAIGALVFSAATVRQTSKQNAATIHSQNTEMFTKAIEQIGDEASTNSRLGGIYTLESVAHNSEVLNSLAYEVLAGFVRNQSPGTAPLCSDSTQADPSASLYFLHAPDDIQAAITVLARRPTNVRESVAIDLSSTCLFGLTMQPGSDLSNTKIIYTTLKESILAGMNLANANLGVSNLTNTDLSNTNLSGANLRYTGLGGADLRGAILDDAVLEGADLYGAKGLADASLINIYYTESTKWPDGFTPPESRANP